MHTNHIDNAHHDALELHAHLTSGTAQRADDHGYLLALAGSILDALNEARTAIAASTGPN